MLGKLGDKIKGGVEKMGDLKDVGVEKVLEMIENFNKCIPLIEHIGYRVSEVEVEIAIIPKFIVHFEKFKDVNDEEVNRIIEINKDNTLFVSIAKGLILGGKIQQKAQIGNLVFSEIEIEATFPPVVKVKFIK